MANKPEQPGILLKEAREAKNISLAEAEQATKIRQVYLRGLEEDQYDVIPSTVQIRGFLRNYATYLGLDAATMINLYNTRHNPGKEETNLEVSRGLPARPFRRFIPYAEAAVGALILGVIVLMIFYRSPSLFNLAVDQKLVMPSSTPVVATQTSIAQVNLHPADATPTQIPLPTTTIVYATATPAPTITPTSVVTTATLQLNLTFSRPCWLQVSQDNKVILTTTQSAGTTLVLTATTNLRIQFGNPAGVAAVFNGTNEGPLAPANTVNPATFEWTKGGKNP